MGEHWSSKIVSAIEASDYFVPCFSSSFAPDSTMAKEVAYAASIRANKTRSDRMWLLPVRLDGCNIPPILLDDRSGLHLSDIHFISLDGEMNWRTGSQALVDVIVQKQRAVERAILVEAAKAVWEAEMSAARQEAWNIENGLEFQLIMRDFSKSSSSSHYPTNDMLQRSLNNQNIELAEKKQTVVERRRDLHKLRNKYSLRFKDDFNPTSDFDWSAPEKIVAEAKAKSEKSTLYYMYPVLILFAIMFVVLSVIIVVDEYIF